MASAQPRRRGPVICSGPHEQSGQCRLAPGAPPLRAGKLGSELEQEILAAAQVPCFSRGLILIHVTCRILLTSKPGGQAIYAVSCLQRCCMPTDRGIVGPFSCKVGAGIGLRHGRGSPAEAQMWPRSKMLTALATLQAVVELRFKTKVPNLGSTWIQTWVSTRLNQSSKPGFEPGFEPGFPLHFGSHSAAYLTPVHPPNTSGVCCSMMGPRFIVGLIGCHGSLC